MKKLIAILMLCVSTQAMALEVEGMKLDDSVQLGNVPLLLNGAGVRSMVFFKMYVAGLYLSDKKASAEAVLADVGAKRIALHVMVGEGETERFLHGFRKGIEKNHGEKEVAALSERMNVLDHLFDAVKTVKKGDVITFDWLPENGTRVNLNGAELGKIGGEDFYRALLSIWIGEKPVSSDLKKGLLGG